MSARELYIPGSTGAFHCSDVCQKTYQGNIIILSINIKQHLKIIKVVAQQILVQTESRILLSTTSSVMAMTILKLICLSAFLTIFLYQVRPS